MKRSVATASKAVPTIRAGRIDFPPSASMGHLLRDCYRELARVMGKRIGSAGLAMSMWFFLRALWERDGMTQRELSRKVKMMEPSAVVALNKLQKLGLVVRSRNSEDSRKLNVFLTGKGRALRERMLPRAIEVNRVLLRGLTRAETATLRGLLERVRANLESDV